MRRLSWRFFNHLEQQRGNTVRSRNLRLAAIRSFFRLVALRDPASVAIVIRVLAIPSKRTDKKLIGYLTRDEVDALLAAPDRNTWKGLCDHALLLTLYNSGARVSEITALERNQVHFGPSTFLQLKGKGRKERVIPLWPHTSRILQAWFQELGSLGGNIAFPSARGRSLSRDGVDFILQRAVQTAAARCPSLATRKITPHVMRHATAMHLLQAGVDMATIALWLGHESIETTHVYIQTDLAIKEQALAKLNPVDGTMARFTADDPLLGFLASL
jgi:integrase/recombinase XerD